jgi:dipeptidyl aminopeptidase/acylaminoacyl peptidase
MKHLLSKQTISRKSSLQMIGIIWLFLICGIVSPVLSQVSEYLSVPETYKTEGIPAIKNSEIEGLFYDPASIRSNLIWDADRKNRRMLVTDATNNVYLIDSPMAIPKKLIEKIVPNSVKISPNGNSFAYTSDQEDQDNYQLYLYDFKEKSSKKLATLAGKDESINTFVWSKSGDSLFFVRVDYESKTTKLCRFNFSTENCYSEQLRGVWDVIQAGETKVLLKHWKASSSQLVYVYDLAANKLIPIDEKGNSRKAFLTKDRVYWTGEGNEKCKKEPCMLSYSFKNNNTNQIDLPPDILNLYDVKISPNGKNLLLQETKDGIDKLRVFKLKNETLGKEIPQFVIGSYVVWNTRWLSDKEVVYTLENIGKPASIQSFHLDTKTVTDWTKESLPPQLENKIKSPELIRWKSFDQKEITGYIVRPNNLIKKTPVLIFVHGGPQILDRPVFNSQDIRLASNLNLAVIHTNIRGSSGFGKEFVDADNKEKRGDAVKDMQTLLNWIGTQPNLDATQVYLRGESYGGFVVLATALQEPQRIKGVIAEYPLVSIRGYLGQSWIDEFAKNEYGDPKDDALMSKLDKLSPLNNTKDWNKIPLFMTRGKLDARIPEKDVIDLKNQLQTNDTEMWFIYSTENGHGFGSNYVFASMYQFLKTQINKEK